MFAIIETGGKQYKVNEGDIIFIEKLEAAEGDVVTFDRVMAISAGDAVKFGAPVVEGAKVTANVLKNGKAKKIYVMKYKPKKNEKKIFGFHCSLLDRIPDNYIKMNKKSQEKIQKSIDKYVSTVI